MQFPTLSYTGALIAGAIVLWSGSAHAQLTVSARAEAAITLPSVAIELRAEGVPVEEVEVALVEVRTYHVPAPEVRLIFTNTIEVVHVHGPLPHFGGFVRMRLREGVRGPRLYEAIRVEHAHAPRGRAKGYYGHPHGGPPGHSGMVRVDVRGRGPSHMATVRVHGGGGSHMASVRVRSPGATVRVRGGGGSHGGSVHVRSGGGGGGGGGGHGGGGGGMGMR